MRSFQRRVIRDVKQREDDHQHDWHHNQQTAARALLVFVFATPLDVVTGRQLRLGRDRILRFVNETPNITTAHVQEHRAAQQTVLAGDHRRALVFADVGKLSQWNRRASRRHDRNLRERIATAAKLCSVTHAHRKAAAAFDCDRKIGFADAFFDRVLDRSGVDSITRGRGPINLDVDVRRTADLFGVDVFRAGHRAHDICDAPRQLLQRLQIVAEDLDADL